jgi:hypothetical protein
VSMDKVRTLNSNLSDRGGWLRFPAPAPVVPAPAPVVAVPADLDPWLATASKAQVDALITKLQAVSASK